MARSEDLYPSAAALGRQDKARPPRLPRLDCIVFRLRDGTEFFYEYRFVSAVKLTPKGELIIHCTCGHVDTITIRGRNLRNIAGAVAKATLGELCETDAAHFTGQSEVIIGEITIKSVEKHPSRTEISNL